MSRRPELISLRVCVARVDLVLFLPAPASIPPCLCFPPRLLSPLPSFHHSPKLNPYHGEFVNVCLHDTGSHTVVTPKCLLSPMAAEAGASPLAVKALPRGGGCPGGFVRRHPPHPAVAKVIRICPQT